MRTRKRAERTERDFRWSICRSAIGQVGFEFCQLAASYFLRVVFEKSAIFFFLSCLTLCMWYSKQKKEQPCIFVDTTVSVEATFCSCPSEILVVPRMLPSLYKQFIRNFALRQYVCGWKPGNGFVKFWKLRFIAVETKAGVLRVVPKQYFKNMNLETGLITFL